MSAAVTPADVLKFTEPTKDFLCPLTANTYGIDFLAFKIRDIDSATVVFEVAKDPNQQQIPQLPDNFDTNQLRTIAYKFPSDFLRYKTVGTTLKFRVGPHEVKNFRMIERHYFKNKLKKSYDFNFPFCIPNSTNEWEAIYDLPVMTEAEIAEFVNSPNDTHSDSFYFVDGKLVMHNKAKYEYEKTSRDRQQEVKTNK